MEKLSRLLAALIAICLFHSSLPRSCLADDWFARPAELEEAQRAAIGSPADQIEPWRKLATLALKHHYAKLAFESAARVLRKQPNDYESQYFQGLATLRIVSDREKKIEGYQKGLEILERLPLEFKKKKKLESILVAAQAAIEAETTIKAWSPEAFRSAARLLETAVQNDPESLIYRESLVWLYVEKLHDPARAYSHARDLADRLPGAEDPSRKVDAYATLAFVTSELGRYEESAEILEKLVEFYPHDDRKKLQLADALLAAGRFASSIALYQQLIETELAGEKSRKVIAKYLGPPTLTDVEQRQYIDAMDLTLTQLRKAAKSGELTDYMPAAEGLAKAARIHPENHFAQVTLGWILLEKVGEPHRALGPLKSAVKIQPGDASSWGLLGMAHYRMGNLPIAIDAYQQALRQDPNDLGIRVNLGMALSRCKQFDLAIDTYDWILERAGDSSDQRAKALLGIAEIRAWQGETQPPMNMARQLLDQNPQFLEARLLLADLERWSWNLTVAEAEYLRVLDADPGNRLAQQSLDEVSRLRAWTPGFDYYDFTDNFQFTRVDYKYSLRAPLTDKTYLTVSEDEWRFYQQSNHTRRTEARLAFEHHLTRTVNLTGSAWTFDYPNADADVAWSVGGRISPVDLPSVSLAYANNEPAYLDSINIPLQNIRMNSLAGGIDVPLNDANSLHGQYIDSVYSDDNRRRFASAQVSHRLFPDYDDYLRLQYEFLTYEDQTDQYFSPDAYHQIRPILDVSHPITDWLWLTLRLETPYVQQVRSGWGYTALIGPDIRLGDSFFLRAHYMKTHLPTNAPFSGDVIVIHVAANF